jgi:dipeptidyl aminopeptidase/acylaminoacyl peptidase
MTGVASHIAGLPPPRFEEIMRQLVALLAFITAPAFAFAQASSLDRLAWMAGCWEQRGPGRVVTEMWMPPAAGVMMGSSRTVGGTRVAAFEQLRIVARGDTLVYIALPSGQTLTEFRSTSVTEGAVKFENPTHDFPRAVLYTRAGADSIIARIEGPGPNNTTRSSQFPMRRVSCTSTPAPPPPAAPPPPPTDTLIMDAEISPDGKRLVLVKGWGSNWDVYLGNVDGSGARPVTDHAMVDYQPSWSPDGTRIVFTSARDGHQEIYTLRADGSALTQLTRGPAHNSEPSWSPDGKQIVFRSERDGGRPHIYVMNADGSNQHALTRDSAVAASPSWSRDGKLILFSSTQTGHSEVYVMNPDGSGRRALTVTDQTGGAKHSGVPSWSPDGKLIAFYSNRDGNQEVYVMNADGSNVRNVSNHPGADAPLGWTRDGFVLFRSARDRPLGDIYKIKADGTGIARVTVTGAR